jgi:hypothetical protein
MSEQLSEDEAYTPRVEQASIYGEQQMMHAFSEWTTEALESKAQYYIDQISSPSVLSTHKAEYARLLDHVIFEVTYRGMERGDV